MRVVPIERLNAILVVSAQPAYLDQAATWIERLDRADDERGAADLRLQRAERPGDQSGRGAGRDLRRQHRRPSGEPSLLAPGLEPVELGSTSGFELGAEQTAGGGRRAPTRPASARSRGDARGPPAAARGGLERSRSRPAPTPESDIRIIADDTTNSLVIQARPREYRKIQQALEKLDVLPLQVLIEATIAEVTLNDELRYGVEWFFRSGDFEAAFSQGRGRVRRRRSFPVSRRCSAATTCASSSTRSRRSPTST